MGKDENALSLPLFTATLKLVVHFFEQDIEGSERTIDSSDVLLQLDLLVLAHSFVGIDLLLHDPKPIANHGYFMEESIDRHFFGLQRGITRLEYHNAIFPFCSYGYDLSIVKTLIKNIVEGLLDISDSDRIASAASLALGRYFKNFKICIILTDTFSALLGFEPDDVELGRSIYDYAATKVRMLNARAYA